VKSWTGASQTQGGSLRWGSLGIRIDSPALRVHSIGEDGHPGPCPGILWSDEAGVL